MLKDLERMKVRRLRIFIEILSQADSIDGVITNNKLAG